MTAIPGRHPVTITWTSRLSGARHTAVAYPAVVDGRPGYRVTERATVVGRASGDQDGRWAAAIELLLEAGRA